MHNSAFHQSCETNLYRGSDPSPSPSFSVAESAHAIADSAKGKSAHGVPTPVPRMLARAGEQFRFRVALTLPAAAATSLEVRLVSGGKLPKFIKIDFVTVAGRENKRTVELSGVPSRDNLGEFSIGVYERGTAAECVGRVDLQVVERS